MWRFTKIYKCGGITVYPGVSLKGDLIETNTTVSLRGSEVFKDVPKSILEPYTPDLPVTKAAKTKKIK